MSKVQTNLFNLLSLKFIRRKREKPVESDPNKNINSILACKIGRLSNLSGRLFIEQVELFSQRRDFLALYFEVKRFGLPVGGLVKVLERPGDIRPMLA